MASAFFVLGLLSLFTPFALMIRDGVDIGDDASFEQWLMDQPLDRLAMMRAAVLGGLMMIFTGVALGLLP